MHRTILIWGMILFALVFISPLPANAQALDIRPVIALGRYAPPTFPGKTYSFYEVWSLVAKYQAIQSSHFSPELVTCLMWEESGFRLVENVQSHALGFGQVMPSTLNAINRRYKTSYTRTQVLTSPDASVQVTLRSLELAYEWKKDKVGALVAYAGGTQNNAIVQKWLAAEPRMIQARWTDASVMAAMRSRSTAQMISAMGMCSQPGYEARAAF